MDLLEALTSLIDDVQAKNAGDYMIGERKVRVLDFDGMGGRSYEYYCGSCHIYLGDSVVDNFCAHCGKSITATEKRDTWGYKALDAKQLKEHSG